MLAPKLVFTDEQESQKKCDDFYELYELNVYITPSGEIELAKSEIFQLILNDFLVAGIDMNSPDINSKVDFVPQFKGGIDQI